MLSSRLDISFVMLLILFSTVSISLLKSNHASAISVGGILGIAKDTMDIFPSLVSAAQSLGIVPKTSTTPPSPSISPSSDADYKQLRQELETKFNTLSAQLAALNENDRQKAKEQLAHTFNETLNPYSPPVRSFILKTTKELAPPNLQNAVCVANASGGAGGTAIASNGGSANASGGAGGTAICGPG